jgi:protein SDA1
MSKGELKREKVTVKEGKDQFKHTPKVKNGGTTNREKNKLKPLMMVRSKKNKIRKDEKQLKLRIKSLKNQLGKVRSGKEAKKRNNKKVVKKTKK